MPNALLQPLHAGHPELAPQLLITRGQLRARFLCKSRTPRCYCKGMGLPCPSAGRRATSFPVVKNLVVDRSGLERIIAAGGYIAQTHAKPHSTR